MAGRAVAVALSASLERILSARSFRLVAAARRLRVGDGAWPACSIRGAGVPARIGWDARALHGIGPVHQPSGWFSHSFTWWRPAFYRAGYERPRDPHDPGPFHRRAHVLMDLLAVAHAAPVLPLVELSHRIDRSGGRLLGREGGDLGWYQRGRSARAFNGFEATPELKREALADAREAFGNRASERYRRMAPVVGRLAEALARDGPFAVADRVLDVGIALERMYVLDEGKISRKLRNRVARYLATDAAGQESVREIAQEFYAVRSDIVHNRLLRLTPERVHAAFRNGFDIARRSLFKLLREGPPEDWTAPGNTGEARE